MDEFFEMRVFVRAVERGSFALAARDFGVTPSAVSKLVTRLEARLGARLLMRTTRRHGLTGEGEIYFEQGRRLIDAFENLEAEVAAVGGQVRGLLRVNANQAFASNYLAPSLPDFVARHPEVRVELAVTDRVVDLIVEQVDVAIRTGKLRDSPLIARKIGETRRVICASPAYLARHGLPRTREDLAEHRLIPRPPRLDGFDRWMFQDAWGRPAPLDVTGPLVTDSTIAALELARGGAGILRIGELLVSHAVALGELVTLNIEGHDAEAAPLSAVTPPGAHRVPRTRAFLDFLTERFGGAPWQLKQPER